MFVTPDQLQAAFGVKVRGKLKETLTANGIKFFVRRDGLPFTTTEAVNEALGIKGKEDDDGLDIEWMED